MAIPREATVKNKVSKEALLLKKETRAYQDSISISDKDLCNWLTKQLGSNESIRSTDINIITAADFFSFIHARRLCNPYEDRFQVARQKFTLIANGKELVDHSALLSVEFTIKKSQNKDDHV